MRKQSGNLWHIPIMLEEIAIPDTILYFYQNVYIGWRCSNFKLHDGVNIPRAYLRGRYGGLLNIFFKNYCSYQLFKTTKYNVLPILLICRVKNIY